MAMFSAEVGIGRILAIPARPGWGPLALPRCGGSVEAELQAAVGWVREGARASPSTVHTAAGRCGAGKASVGIAQALSSQGRKPTGPLGWVTAWVMPVLFTSLYAKVARRLDLQPEVRGR